MGTLKKLKQGGAAALFTLLVFGLPATAWANAGGDGPDVVGALAGFAAISAACLIFNLILDKLGLPAILGWIMAGVAFANAAPHYIHELQVNQFLILAGEAGIVFLMFRSGLEARPDAIKRNLLGAGAVAILGVLFVGGLGFLVAKLMLPEGTHWLGYIFVAAALTPTSAGIGAAIFAALNKASSNEGIMTLVAAVLDDVIGLVILALLDALAKTVQSGQPIEAATLMIEAAKGLGFVGFGFFLGVWVLPKYLPGALKLQTKFVLYAAIVACLAVAYFGTFFGLAPLIGGYVAGLIFEQVRYKEDSEDHSHGHVFELEHAVAPLVDILAPIFFFFIGTRVPLSAFANPSVLGLAAALTAACFVGKVMSGIGVIGGARKATVIAGMMPRGEVAGIMVNKGAQISAGGVALVSPEVFTAFVIMITATTLISIFGLNRFLREPKPGALRHSNVDGGR